MASNDAEDNVALRGNTQAYLVNSLRQLLPAMHKKRGGQYTEHLVHTRFRSTELVSEFNKTSGIMDYMNALPAQLSGLMPKIRIFLRHQINRTKVSVWIILLCVRAYRAKETSSTPDVDETSYSTSK